VLDLKAIFEICTAGEIDVLKIDIEGAEYDLLLRAPSELLAKTRRVLVEFHDHCVVGVSEADNQRVIERLGQLNFLHHSVDGVNYVFFRRPPGTRFGQRTATRSDQNFGVGAEIVGRTAARTWWF